MEQRELEAAVARLGSILALDVVPESLLQAFFEEHTVAFRALGYAKAFPHPRFTLDDGEALVPDFVLVQANGLLSICDLKKPGERLLVSRKPHREDLSADLSSGLAQLAEYQTYFESHRNREAASTTLGIPVHHSPDMVLIVGRQGIIDRTRLHGVLRRRQTAVRLLTYDDVYAELFMGYIHAYGSRDHLSGVSWHALLELERVSQSRRKYIFDIGQAPTRDRWSVFVDENDCLTCEVIDGIGRAHVVASPLNFDADGRTGPLYVACEFGASDSAALLRISIGGVVMAQLAIDGVVALSPSMSDQFKEAKWTLGADMEARCHGRFSISEMLVLGDVVSLEERLNLAGYFQRRSSLS